MFDRLKKLYDLGRATEATLDNAVVKGWITEDQKSEIINT